MQAARIRLPDGRISWTVLDAEHETVQSARDWLLHLENIPSQLLPPTAEGFVSGHYRQSIVRKLGRDRTTRTRANLLERGDAVRDRSMPPRIVEAIAAEVHRLPALSAASSHGDDHWRPGRGSPCRAL